MSKMWSRLLDPDFDESPDTATASVDRSIMSTALHPAFKEFLICLHARKVRYIVVGAFALAALGRPRATKDIDILVDSSLTNLRRLAAALDLFGYQELARAIVGHFSVEDRMAILGLAPVSGSIALLNEISRN